MITMRVTERSLPLVARRVPRSRYAAGGALLWCGAALRRLWVEHGPGTDEGARSLFAHGRNRVATRVAADVRRRGLRVGGRALHGGRSGGRAGLRRALRRARPRRHPPRPVGGRRAGAAQEAPAA